MKIAISGTANQGKSTLIDEMIKRWPMYKKADESYRDLAKKNPKVTLNQDGGEEAQEIIRDALIDQTFAYTRDDNVLFDRCVLDNLVYSLWLNHKKKVSDLFIEKQISIVKESLRLYDIIFFIPMLPDYEIPIEQSADGQRDIDPLFIKEIDNLFKAMVMDYRNPDRKVFFPSDDCPAIIDIPVGPIKDRLDMVGLYINIDGKAFGEEDSLLTV